MTQIVVNLTTIRVKWNRPHKRVNILTPYSFKCVLLIAHCFISYLLYYTLHHFIRLYCAVILVYLPYYYGYAKKKKSCLVDLHRPPLTFKNWKRVFTVQIPPLIFRIQKKKKCFFFFLWEFWCFLLVYILLLVLNLYKYIFSKV